MVKINRLEGIVRSDRLKDKRIIVTGCGYKPVRYIFHDITTGEPSHDPIDVDGQEMKLNIGSAVAGVLALNGATVHMVSTSRDKLENIKKSLATTVDDGSIEYSAFDLLSEGEIRKFVSELPKDKILYWVQSLGLGSGSYKVKDDNPYLPLEDISLELMNAELSLVPATHIMMKAFLPIFRKQKESRIAVISSMSAIRGYPWGGTHCSSKGAIDRYANSAMLELYKDNIFVATIRPGGVDTGMYDNPKVQEAVKRISDEGYSGIWRKQITLAPPTVVGEAVNYVFTTPAHIPSLNIVAKGQFPHEGS